MRLLIESPNCNAFAGSNAAVGYGWATQLAAKHDVYVVTYGPSWERGGPTPAVPFTVIPVGPGRSVKLGARTDFLIEASRARDALIARVKPDVVHSIEPGGWGGPRALATTTVPYVLGPIAGGAVEHPRAFSAEVLEALPVKPARALLSGGPKRLALRLMHETLYGDIPTTRLLGHRAMRKAKLILLATAVQRGAIPMSCQERTRRIPLMGIDLELFRPRDKRRDGPLTVLYAGRVVSIKCLHLLIEAMARTDAVLRVAGVAPGDQAWYGEFCRRRAEELGVADRITWLGHVSREDLAAEYARADLTAMLSLWDTYGLTYVESMACGTPVVGLAAGGAAEIVTSETGWLVRPTTVAGAVEQLVERLQAASADRGELRAMGRNARAHAEREFDWSRLVDRMGAFYAESRA